jgi:Tol biopolymer transport system component
MGEVYRARDTRLGREVAVKVLPSHLSGDPGRRERFEREARAVSALNHPNICVLHDIGSQEGVDFLVLEHLEGETLAARLARGPLPPDQVLRFAAQVADALDKAHRQGIVHRDLKPANVMLTKSGTKLLDFGLAKLREEGPGPGGPAGATGASLLPTATRQLTTAGTVLGTFQYMAPEQLEGKEADVRTDIFALGVLVYEMATGRKAFEGASQASLIAAILKEQPRPIAELQPLSPVGLDRIVQACLAKDPDERIQMAHDVRLQLAWLGEEAMSGASSSAGLAARRTTDATAGRRRVGALVAGIGGLLIGLAGAALTWWLRTPVPAQRLSVNLELPSKTHLDSQNTSLAFSPDGRTLAFAATGPEGKQMLWLRALDSLQAQPISGTDGATYPFWSPDGRFIGFFAEGKLKKVQAGGGTVQTLCEAGDGRGASWGADGTIVFAPAPFGGLSQVPSAGGAPTPLTTLAEDGTTHRLPHFLPDGRRLLFFASQPGKKDTSGIQVIDLETKAVTLVAKENSEGRYVPPGNLVFVRDGNLMAQPMDLASLRLAGEAVPIAEKVSFNPNRWTGAFTLSETGLMLYQTGTAFARSQLTWFDADGRGQGNVGEPANFVDVKLSPDGRRAAATVLSSAGRFDIWLYDLLRGVGSRFTFDQEGASSPLWSPDGRLVAYTDFNNRIFAKASDGASEARGLLMETGANRGLDDWSPDGSSIFFWSQAGSTGIDVHVLPLAQDGKPRPVFATSATERYAHLSPDGRWLLYSSDESGRPEVYVVSYPGPGGRWQVSTGGAQGGVWVEEGRRIVYADLADKLWSVDVTSEGGNLSIGGPRAIFGGRPAPQIGSLSRDGRRYLAAVPLQEAVSSSLVLVTDWTAELKGP